MPESVKKSLVLTIYFILAFSTFLVFWQVRDFEFISYDDNSYVYENPRVLNGLTADALSWAFTTNHSANWHPITWLSLMLDCQLFGANPGRMHLVNLFLHLANTLLLFTILGKMTASLWPSAFVAAAFVLHPMHVESVAWISERKDVLSTFFLLLTLAAYVSYVRRRTVFRYITVLAVFALGLMAKPMLVTLPFVLLLLDYWPLNRLLPQTVAVAGQKRKSASAVDKKSTLYQIIIEKVPFFALSVVSSIITFLAQRSSGAVTNIDTISLNNRIANVFVSYTRYIGKTFWPQNLAVLYPFDAGRIPFWQVAIYALLLIVISIFVIRFGRTQRYLLVGWFWFLGTLIPVIGIVQVGSQAYADRYTYIPYIGLFIMLAWLLPHLLSNWPQRKIALGLLMILVLAPLGICAHRQTSYWNNSFTLFSHAIEVTQNNYVAYNGRGVAYDRLGRYTEAIEAYQQAIRIKPNYAEGYYNIGNTYGKLGRLQDAVEAYKQAIRIKPNDAEMHNNLGVAFGKLGRLQDAADAYKQAVRIKPDYAEAYYNLGNTCRKLGRYPDAIEAYKQAIKIMRNFALAHYNLGVVYLATGDKSSALEEYKILQTLDAAKANELFKLINK